MLHIVDYKIQDCMCCRMSGSGANEGIRRCSANMCALPFPISCCIVS